MHLRQVDMVVAVVGDTPAVSAVARIWAAALAEVIWVAAAWVYMAAPVAAASVCAEALVVEAT